MTAVRTVAGCVLLVAACGRPAPRADAPALDTARAAPAPVAPAAEGLTFSAALAGFDFAIPASWGRRYSVSERADPADFPGAGHAVEFVYLPDEGGEPPSLLTVLVYDRSAWAGGRRVGEVVAERGDRVFVAIRPEGNPLTGGSPDAVRLDSTRLTREQVRERLNPR
ncbi:MAG: hypothetical protein MUC69_00855 [Gemmatimonadales bacterium]|jgi:hypothetical protein|nr:hypothetical protein [Gemmatimonadales bacterium]